MALTSLVGMTASANAEEIQDFDLHNETGKAITSLFVSEDNNPNWEEDVLGVDVLPNGDSTQVKFKGYGDGVCKFDIKITVEGSETGWVVQDVNLCETTKVSFQMDGDTVTWSKE